MGIKIKFREPTQSSDGCDFKILAIFLLILTCFFSFYAGDWRGRTNERARMDSEKHSLTLKNIDYRFELNRCRGWVDDMGAQIMKERGRG